MRWLTRRRESGDRLGSLTVGGGDDHHRAARIVQQRLAGAAQHQTRDGTPAPGPDNEQIHLFAQVEQPIRGTPSQPRYFDPRASRPRVLGRAFAQRIHLGLDALVPLGQQHAVTGEEAPRRKPVVDDRADVQRCFGANRNRARELDRGPRLRTTVVADADPV